MTQHIYLMRHGAYSHERLNDLGEIQMAASGEEIVEDLGTLVEPGSLIEVYHSHAPRAEDSALVLQKNLPGYLVRVAEEVRLGEWASPTKVQEFLDGLTNKAVIGISHQPTLFHWSASTGRPWSPGTAQWRRFDREDK